MPLAAALMPAHINTAGKWFCVAWQDVAATFKKEGVVKTYYVPTPDLPESIQANSEAYFQGDWRKVPYPPRCRDSLLLADTPGNTCSFAQSNEHPDGPPQLHL